MYDACHMCLTVEAIGGLRIYLFLKSVIMLFQSLIANIYLCTTPVLSTRSRWVAFDVKQL